LPLSLSTFRPPILLRVFMLKCNVNTYHSWIHQVVPAGETVYFALPVLDAIFRQHRADHTCNCMICKLNVVCKTLCLLTYTYNLKTRSYKKDLRNCVFHLYGEDGRNYKLLIIKFRVIFLCWMVTSAHTIYVKILRYKFEFVHSHRNWNTIDTHAQKKIKMPSRNFALKCTYK